MSESITSTLDPMGSFAKEWIVRREFSVGIYHFSAVADARNFDWEELYFNLHRYGNHGERTGPWDFDLREENMGNPLVPSYWVYLDGKNLGIWYWQRISLEDLAGKQFRGNFSFEISQAGEHELRLVPYRSFKIHWTEHQISVDSNNSFDGAFEIAHPIQPAIFSPDFWDSARRRITSESGPLRAGLEAILAIEQEQWERHPDGRVARQKTSRNPEDLLALYSLYRLFGNRNALETASLYVETLVAKPFWGGKASEESYGRDGDMIAAVHFQALAHWLVYAEDEISTSQKAAVLEKLRYQGERFVALSLLHQDYWGGSIMQEHGRKSFFDFTTGCLLLQGRLKEASHWLEYCLPRALKGLEAMPLDGAIPPSSNGNLRLYTWQVCRFRDAWLAQAGIDVFKKYPFAPILEKLNATLVAEDISLLEGCSGFLRRMQAVTGSSIAAHWENAFLEHIQTSGNPPSQFATYGLLDAVLCGVSPGPAEPANHRAQLIHFPDSGKAVFCDPANKMKLEMACGPWLGFHAYEKATGPCDRMQTSVAAGHFTLSVAGKQYLHTPDSAYSLRAIQRTGVLIDDAGPYGDIGYPMSIPAYQYRGERIVDCHWDELRNEGSVKVDLQPLFEESVGVLKFTRRLTIQASREVICEDHLMFAQARRASWLFQGDFELIPEGFLIRETPCLFLSLRSSNTPLAPELQKTPVVYSYTGSGRAFRHARWDALEARRDYHVSFSFILGDQTPFPINL